MAKGFAIHNAPTDHGGLIPATQFRDSQMGNAFVRAGDGHFCPKCKCWSTVIKSHDHVIIDGKAVAFVGDKLTCGATIQPQQSHVVGDAGGSTGGSNSSLSTSLLASTSQAIFEDKFKLIAQSGEALKNINYQVTRSDGSIEIGTTNKNCFTHAKNTNDQAEIISIKATYDY